MNNKTTSQTNVEAEIQKDIFKLTNELKKTNSTNRAARIIETLAVIDEIINDNNLNINYPREYHYELKKFKMKEYDQLLSNYYYYLNILPMEGYNKKLCKISDYFNNKYKIIKKLELYQKVDLATTVELTEAFLYQYDRELFNFFEGMSKTNRIFFGNTQSSGLTIHSNYLMDPYIVVAPTFTIDDASTLIHEIFHAHISMKANTINDAEDALNLVNNYFEVYSVFSELLYSDYLNKTKFSKESPLYGTLILSSLCDSLDKFKENNYNDIDSERYSYGYVLAYHFYDQYKKDPIQAKKNIISFMLDSKEHLKMEMLNKYGLNSIDILNPQKIEKHVKYLERRY